MELDARTAIVMLGIVTYGVCGWIIMYPADWIATDVFAFGFGIDRLAVMRYQTDDLREFVNNDVRFLKQF